MTDDNTARVALALTQRVLQEIERLMTELTPQQLHQLEDGTATLALVPVEQDDRPE